MVRDNVIVYFSFWAIFALPPPPPNFQNFKKKEKNPWRYHHFTEVHQILRLDDVQLPTIVGKAPLF